MLHIDRERAKEAFHTYTAQYDLTDAKVQLKIEHTYQVAGLCERIAREVSGKEEDIELAWLCGLLHDVGRFEQLRVYGTFQDAVSVDHAAYGADILFVEGRIRDYVQDATEDGLIEQAIRLHNVYRMPPDLPERVLLFANILRDADKIDIMRANVKFPFEEIYNVTTEELMQAQLSEEALENFRNRRTSLRKPGDTVLNSLVNQISFAFELNYPISLQIMADQGYLDKLLAFSSENPVTIEQMKVVRQEMETFLKEKGVR